MSGYNLGVNTPGAASDAGYAYDKQQTYNQFANKTAANFSVSHLLDLEVLPRDNCAMFASGALDGGLAALQTASEASGQTCCPLTGVSPSDDGHTKEHSGKWPASRATNTANANSLRQLYTPRQLADVIQQLP